MTLDDPDTVPCPDCLAPAGTPCDSRYGTHAARADRVRARAINRTLTDGTCGLCGRRLLQVSDPETGDPYDTWHPATVTEDGPACPVEPSMSPYDAAGWARFIASGLRTGRPGHQHFIPPTEETPGP